MEWVVSIHSNHDRVIGKATAFREALILKMGWLKLLRTLISFLMQPELTGRIRCVAPLGQHVKLLGKIVLIGSQR